MLLCQSFFQDFKYDELLEWRLAKKHAEEWMYEESKQMLTDSNDRLSDYTQKFKDKIKIIVEPYPTVDPIRNKVLTRGIATDASFNDNINDFMQGYISTIMQ